MQSSRPFVIPAFSSRHLSVLVVGAVVIIAEIKADKKDIPNIISTLFGSNGFVTLGWVVAGIILATAVVVIWLLTRKYDKEMDRVCKERDRLQEFILKGASK